MKQIGIVEYNNYKQLIIKNNKMEKYLQELVNQLVNSNEEIGIAIENLNEGDVYGDKIADSLGCIAESLRILSGRQELKK